MLEDIKFKYWIYCISKSSKGSIRYKLYVEKAILKIFDINGRLVLTDLVFSNSEINISELVTGTYIIILSAENGKTGVQKFVKE